MSSRGSLYYSIRGFTLVELLVVTAIMAVLAVVVAPSIAQNLANRRIRNAASELQSSILQARSLAVIASRPVEMWPTYTSATPNWNLPTASRGDSVTGQPVNIPNQNDTPQMSIIAKAKLSWVVVTAGPSTAAGVPATLANGADSYPIQVSLPDQTLITVTTLPVVSPSATNGIRFFPTGGIGNITASGTASTPFTQLTFLVCDSAAPGTKGYNVIVNQFGGVRTAGGATCT